MKGVVEVVSLVRNLDVRYYSVIVVQKDCFESRIINERHFGCNEEELVLMKKFVDSYDGMENLFVAVMDM